MDAWLDILSKRMDSFQLHLWTIHSLRVMLIQFFCVQITYQIFRSYTFWFLKISKQPSVSNNFFSKFQRHLTRNNSAYLSKNPNVNFGSLNRKHWQLVRCERNSSKKMLDKSTNKSLKVCSRSVTILKIWQSFSRILSRSHITSVTWKFSVELAVYSFLIQLSILEKKQFLMILIKVNKQLTAEKGENCEMGKKHP